MNIFSFCESPIEKAFLGAFVCLAQQEFGGVEVYEASGRIHDSETPVVFGTINPLRNVAIYCQPPAPPYRVDFMVLLVQRHEGKVKKRGIVIECDGHDFHEKTKEQASRDKKRDREIQKMGFPVLRFSGSDIWKDAAACAQEIAEMLAEKGGKTP